MWPAPIYATFNVSLDMSRNVGLNIINNIFLAYSDYKQWRYWELLLTYLNKPYSCQSFIPKDSLHYFVILLLKNECTTCFKGTICQRILVCPFGAPCISEKKISNLKKALRISKRLSLYSY